MKILYFTGTGNCLAIAKRFNAELLSVPKFALLETLFKMRKINLFLNIIVKVAWPVLITALKMLFSLKFKKAKIDSEIQKLH